MLFRRNKFIEHLAPIFNVIPRTSNTPLFSSLADFGYCRIPILIPLIEIFYTINRTSFTFLETTPTSLAFLLIPLIVKKLKFLHYFSISHFHSIYSFGLYIPSDFRKLMIWYQRSWGCGSCLKSIAPLEQSDNPCLELWSKCLIPHFCIQWYWEQNPTITFKSRWSWNRSKCIACIFYILYSSCRIRICRESLKFLPERKQDLKKGRSHRASNQSSF